LPYIDFHYGVGKDQDFNVRLMNDASGQLTLFGNQQITGNLSFGPNTRQMLDLSTANYGIGVQNNTTYFRTATQFSWFKGGTHSDNQGDPGPGGVTLMALTGGGQLTVSGPVCAANVSCASDRNVKAGFESLNPRLILEKVAALPITRWH